MSREQWLLTTLLWLICASSVFAAEPPSRPPKPGGYRQEAWEEHWKTFSQLHECLRETPAIKPQKNGVLYMSVESAGMVRRKGAKGADELPGRPLRNMKVEVWRHPRIRANDEELVLDPKALPVRNGTIPPGVWDMAVVLPCWRVHVPEAGRYLLVVTHATAKGRNATVEILSFFAEGKRHLKQPIADVTGEHWDEAQPIPPQPQVVPGGLAGCRRRRQRYEPA
jgi:hypothetical protein